MRRPRHVSPEERALWDVVARRATPLATARMIEAPDPVIPPAPHVMAPMAQVMRDPLPVFHVGQKVDHTRSNDLLPGLAERMGQAPAQMDHKSYGKLKKGKLVPEARIDLHGMTLSEAHPALTGFILKSHGAGRRLVLVITGKGKLRDYDAPMPVRQGVLRHQVPQWLSLPPLGPLVLQVAAAHVSHGGQGAYYVYLRRLR